MLSPQHLAEFEASAISPELAAANAQSLSGPEAIEAFLEATIASRQKVTSYLTAGNARLMGRYSFLEDGCWIAFGESIEGIPGDIAYAKPDHPRYDEARKRPLKYENPPGLEARPLLPLLEPAWGKIAELWGLDRAPGESCWQAVLRQVKRCPIAITEGWKKALALAEQGIPAIALRGITQWHPKGQTDLWPDIAALVAGGRKVAIAFDQDDKASTRKAVSQQTRKLAGTIERAGGKASSLQWEGKLGKGLDDALAALPPEQRQEWLGKQIRTAPTAQQLKRDAHIEISKAILAQPAPDPQRVSMGDRYIDELPPLRPGLIQWVTANMGGGKSVAIARDWARPFAKAGGIVIWLAPLNSLGQQTGKDAGFPHIHDYLGDSLSQQALQMDIRASGGIVACLNSAPRVLRLIPQDAPVLVVIDEAGQTLGDAAGAGTLKSRYSDCWEAAIALMQRAILGGGAIALAEDGLSTDTIGLVKALSGTAQTYGINHRRLSQPWPVTLYRATPPSAFRGEVLAACQHAPQIVVTSSKAEAKRMERAALDRGIDAIAIHSDSNEGGKFSEFFENPDRWLKGRRPQLLILSPSAKTGLSIEGGVSVENAYFEQVWGWFPALDLDCWMQLLGRYRPSVPRQIWASAYINPEHGEAPHRWTQLNELEQLETYYAKAAGVDSVNADPQDAAIKDFLAARRQRAWAAKIRAADALADALVAAGHTVEVIRDGIKADSDIADLWAEIKEQLAREAAALHAGLTLDPAIHTPEWAAKLLRDGDASYEQRCMAAKVRTIARFPGLDWDDADLWYIAEFQPRTPGDDGHSTGPIAPGAALWAEADHARALWDGDAKQAREILEKRLRASHLLPKAGLSAQLASLVKPHAEALGKLGEVAPGCPHALAIKAIMLEYCSDARRIWRINCTPEQSEVAIANKVLRKFCLVAERTRRVMVDGKEQWVYRLTAPARWADLAAARQQSLGDRTNSLNSPFNEFVRSPQQPPAPPPPGESGGAGNAIAAATVERPQRKVRRKPHKLRRKLLTPRLLGLPPSFFQNGDDVCLSFYESYPSGGNFNGEEMTDELYASLPAEQQGVVIAGRPAMFRGILQWVYTVELGGGGTIEVIGGDLEEA